MQPLSTLTNCSCWVLLYSQLEREKMAKFRINQFWIWVVSSVLILALFVLTLQLLIPLSPLVLGTKLRPEGTDHKHAHNTIYNPGEEILRAPTGTQRGRSPSFLFDFRERHDLESLDSKADEAWSNAMSTPLGGFLLVQHNETYYRGWGVSMFHSIHCLGMLRTSFQNFFGLADGKGHHGDHIHGPGGQMINERQHVEHCLGYIGRVGSPCWPSAILKMYKLAWKLTWPCSLCSSRHCFAMAMIR